MVWFRNRTIILKGLHFLYSRSRNQTELSPGIQTQATDRRKRLKLLILRMKQDRDLPRKKRRKEPKERQELLQKSPEARLRDIAGKHYAANQVVRYEPIFLTDFTLQPQLKREPSVLKALMTQKNIRRSVYVYVRFIGNFAKFMAKKLMTLNSAHLNLITLWWRPMLKKHAKLCNSISGTTA